MFRERSNDHCFLLLLGSWIDKDKTNHWVFGKKFTTDLDVNKSSLGKCWDKTWLESVKERMEYNWVEAEKQHEPFGIFSQKEKQGSSSSKTLWWESSEKIEKRSQNVCMLWGVIQYEWRKMVIQSRSLQEQFWRRQEDLSTSVQREQSKVNNNKNEAKR